MKSCASRACELARGSFWLGAFLALNSIAAAQDVGYSGPALTGVGPTVGWPQPTASKPESKLWFNDGSWWGVLWSASAQAFHIQRLNWPTHAWVDTGIEIDARPDSHSDTLFDGSKLYIVTHEFSHGGGGDPNDPQLFFRFSYAAGKYTLDPLFPVTIGDGATETMVIEKDSTGRIWAVYKKGYRVHYTYTMGADELWAAPAVLPACTTDFDSDDICTIAKFNGNRIGVMWSDKVQRSFLFARHFDSDPPTSWTPSEVALAEWDDHINMATDSSGRVFAVIKNSAEYVKLLVRGAGGIGGWQTYLVSDRLNRLTRPVVMLNESDRTVRVYATALDGTIREKKSSMDTISFAPDLGTIVIKDADAKVNNPTISKRIVGNSTGYVVLAANETATGTYWHHEVPPATNTGGLVLQTPTPGTAGVSNVFKCTGGTPGKYVAFYAGSKTGSSLIPVAGCPGGGLTIGIAAPFQRLGLVRVDNAGVATLNSVVPATAAGKTFQLQAIESASCRVSNLIAETF